MPHSFFRGACVRANTSTDLGRFPYWRIETGKGFMRIDDHQFAPAHFGKSGTVGHRRYDKTMAGGTFHKRGTTRTTAFFEMPGRLAGGGILRMKHAIILNKKRYCRHQQYIHREYKRDMLHACKVRIFSENEK